MSKLVGLVGWRGMVGSVLMDRMVQEKDFDLIEPVFFSTSNAGGKAPAQAKNETTLKEANDIDALVNHVRHPHESVRMGILLAMRKLERNEIASFLGDSSPRIVTEAARAINDQPIPGAMEALARLVERPGLTEAPLMRRVLNANYRFGTEATARALAAYSTREDAPVNFRVEAIDALTKPHKAPYSVSTDKKPWWLKGKKTK